MNKLRFPGMLYSYTSRLGGILNNQLDIPGSIINFDLETDFVVTDIRTSGNALVYARIQQQGGVNFDNVEKPFALGFNLGVVGAGSNGIKVLQRAIIPASTRLNVTFSNQSGANILTPVEVSFIGYKIPRQYKELIQVPYCYLSRLAALPNGASLNGSLIKLTNTDDFMLTDIRTTGEPQLQFLISSSDQNFGNILPSTNQIGAGLNGIKLLNPVRINESSSFDIQFTNSTGGALANVELELWGYKVNPIEPSEMTE